MTNPFELVDEALESLQQAADVLGDLLPSAALERAIQALKDAQTDIQYQHAESTYLDREAAGEAEWDAGAL